MEDLEKRPEFNHCRFKQRAKADAEFKKHGTDWASPQFNDLTELNRAENAIANAKLALSQYCEARARGANIEMTPMGFRVTEKTGQ